MEITDLYIVEEIIPNQSDPRPLMLNPINIIQPMFIPAAFSFGVVVGFYDIKVGDSLGVRILDNNGYELLSIPPVFITENLVNENFEKELRGAFLTTQLKNVILKEEGTIKIVTMVNGVENESRDYLVRAKNK